MKTAELVFVRLFIKSSPLKQIEEVSYTFSFLLPDSHKFLGEEVALVETSGRQENSEDFFFAFFISVAFLMVIALGEVYASKEAKYSDVQCATFKNKRKELLGSSSAVVKPSKMLTSVDSSKPAELVDVGNVSLVYKLFDISGKPTAIFKPYEGVKAETSGFVLSSAKLCLNEVHAYNFDRLSPAAIQAGVPETKHVKISSKLFNQEDEATFVKGSLQQFSTIKESCEDFGAGVFSTDFVHKIGILDLKILNCDRHSGNILFHLPTKQMVPIDHALSFPEAEFELNRSEEAFVQPDFVDEKLVLKNVSFDWIMFPQSKEPFSPATLESVKALSIQQHLDAMKRSGQNVNQRMATFASMTLLKNGALYKKTLHEIGKIAQRQGDRRRPSVLEELLAETCQKVNTKKLSENNEEEFQHFCQVFKQDLEAFWKV